MQVMYSIRTCGILLYDPNDQPSLVQASMVALKMVMNIGDFGSKLFLQTQYSWRLPLLSLLPARATLQYTFELVFTTTT